MVEGHARHARGLKPRALARGVVHLLSLTLYKTFGDVVEFLHFSLIVEIVIIVRTVPSVELLEVLEEGRGCTSSYVIYLRSISSISSVKLTDEQTSGQASKQAEKAKSL
jgi:hypothetical protein